ncbi:MAG: glutamine--fructose-6-phosphate transaminase (isomerizing) [Patescibacteria group bacterium]
MCGIVGCISKDNVVPFLLEGLHKESYRGYDSSGLCVFAPAPVTIKAVGHLDQLESKLAGLDMSGHLGIGHNRWATHGGVTEQNAHPHADCKERIFVVHNGIIENHAELKGKLQEKGHTFGSETDTEVLAHLIEQFYTGNLEDAVRQSLQVVRGTYGLIAISADEPDKMVAARMSSPVVVSVAGTKGYVASDPTALAGHTEHLTFLDDGEVAVIKAGEFHVTDLNSKIKYKPLTKLDWSSEAVDLGAYPHFMLKEIHEQPVSLTNTLRGRLLPKTGDVRLGGLTSITGQLRRVKRCQIVACGTACYAGRVGEYMLEEQAGIPCEVDIASEYRYRNPMVDKYTAFVFISQSGETGDTLAALEEVKRKGGLTLGIVNTIGSSIARATEAGVYNHAGPEIGVASTKAFTSQLAVLAMLTVLLGRQRHMSQSTAAEIIQELARLPEKLAAAASVSEKTLQRLAENLVNARTVLYIGRKYQYPIALEGALKLKEVSYIHAEGYGAGELKHGAMALIDKAVPTVAICTQDSVYEKTLSNLQEIKSRSGPIIAIATEGDTQIESVTKDVIYVPQTLEMLQPIINVVPLQLLAYYAGVARGLNIDKPRNLAKSVTVE